MENKTFTKSDFLTPTQMAKKHHLDAKLALTIAADLFKKQIHVPASVHKTEPNIVYRNKACHHDNAFIIHPLGAEIFLKEYTKRINNEI